MLAGGGTSPLHRPPDRVLTFCCLLMVYAPVRVWLLLVSDDGRWQTHSSQPVIYDLLQAVSDQMKQRQTVLQVRVWQTETWRLLGCFSDNQALSLNKFQF